MQRYLLAFKIAREELILFFLVVLITFFLAAMGIYYFENQAQPELYASVFHSLWWSVVTLTTVGYGDIYPITVGGKIFTSVLILVGLGVIAVPSGLMAAALLEAKKFQSVDTENSNHEKKM